MKRWMASWMVGLVVGLTVGLVSLGAMAQSASAAGEVTKLDKAVGRVTLKHGEIKGLDMPPMTMTYRVKEPRLLDDLKAGDRVRFAVERIDGQYVVTALSKAP
ncbi:MAG: copper-binding protein [Rubrivivax sp.]|nr:copper-binding protein [Rubrivivax sp.]